MTLTAIDIAIALIDDVIGPPDPAAEREHTEHQRAAALGILPAHLGQGTETQGCPSCGGTMWRTVDTDENGLPTGAGPFVCDNPNCADVSG